MKNNTEGSIFKKKGFFIALYSSLGAVMVLALVISFTNMTPNSPNYELASEEQNGTDETKQVIADQVQSYLAQAELDEQAWLRPRKDETPTPSPLPLPTKQPAVPYQPKDVPTPPPPAHAVPVTEPELQPDSVPTKEPLPTNEPVAAIETPVENQNAIAFTPFSENDKMVWPVTGDIAMVFSIDRLVYDPTLDQYRTNDDLRIAAKEGTPVKSGFDGKVLEVGKNNVYGHYVSIDHGNGYAATYGQLMDGVLVSEGAMVKAGQVIGGVGKPSYFGSLNGTHVNLRVTKDENPIDPRGILLAEAEN